MNRKNLPLLLMLLAGGFTSVMTFVWGYPIKDKLITLLLVLLVFFFLGSLMQGLLDYFDKQNLKKAEEEGEVLEKEADSEEQGEDEHG